MTRCAKLFTPLMSLLMFASCERNAPIGTHVTVRDSADIRIVESAGSLWRGMRSLVPEPLVQIGAADGPDPYVFGTVADVVFVRGGGMAMTDSYANEVRFFDGSGQHVATFGRSGEGPNEFRGIGRLYRYLGDSLAVFDFGLSRSLIVPVPGGAARAVPGIHEGTRAPLFGVLDDGSLLSYRAVFGASDPRNAADWDTLAIVSLDRTGQEWRELRRVPNTQLATGPQRQRRILAPSSFVVASQDGFYWARTDEYAIHFFDSLGVLRRLIRRPVQPEPLTAANRSQYAEGTLARLEADGRTDAARMYRRLVREGTYANTRPLFFTAFVDVDQRLWVSDWPWPARFAAPSRWSVFSPEGEWLGDVGTSDRLFLHDAKGDTVLAHWTDELGVSHLRIHLLEPTQ